MSLSQSPDFILFSDHTFCSTNTPACEIFYKLGMNPLLEAPSSSLWRGYQATWAVSDGKLYLEEFFGFEGLAKLNFNYFFPDWMSHVFAFWVNRKIFCKEKNEIRHKRFHEITHELDVSYGRVAAFGKASSHPLLERFLDREDLSGHMKCRSKKIKSILGDEKTDFSAAIPPIIAEKIKSGESPVLLWREYLGFSIGDIAISSGIDANEIKSIENRKRKMTKDTLRKISGSMGIFPGMIC